MNQISANTNNVTPIQPNIIDGKVDAQQMMFDPETYKYMYCIAEAMATGKSTIPDHLKGNVGDCMAIVMQAAQWNMSPWSVAQKTSEVKGKLLYEGQLVTAVINARLPMYGRLQFKHYGDWTRVFGKFAIKQNKYGKDYLAQNWSLEDEQGLGVTVIGHIKGEDAPRAVDVLLTQCHPRNSTYWASNPKQQICYLASRVWARLNCPDVIMGVYCPDEFEPEQQQQPKEKDITPPKQDVASQLIAELSIEQPEVNEKQAQIDLDMILEAVKHSETIEDLQEIKEKASSLPEPYRTEAKSAYKAQKAEIQSNLSGKDDSEVAGEDLPPIDQH